MAKISFFVCCFILLITNTGVSQVVIHIESIPPNTPVGSSIFLAGNINGWNPGDPNYELEVGLNGDYWIDITSGSGTMEFKFTRGSWATVEGNENGNFLPNRTFTFGIADTLQLTILSWEDLGGTGVNSSANEQVMIWDSAMYMPQLNRYRRIWVYLPQDYNTSVKNYKVLYMHDGQNVFDSYTSYIGEWEVDETLTEMENNGLETAIVVAIDNGTVHRIDEYSPFINASYGGGEGDEYLDFIINTLKPKVDSTFRTLSGPENTGIMGSSMGGLISHYAHFRNPEIFGRVGIFSPSFWFSDDFFSYTIAQGLTGSPRLFLLAGALETQIANCTNEMFDTLISIGFTEDELKKMIIGDGEHSEWFWAREFEDAFVWLFNSSPQDINNELNESIIKVFPNPTKDAVQIIGEGNLIIDVYSFDGAHLFNTTIQNEGNINLSEISTASVIIRINQKGMISSHKIIRP